MNKESSREVSTQVISTLRTDLLPPDDSLIWHEKLKKILGISRVPLLLEGASLRTLVETLQTKEGKDPLLNFLDSLKITFHTKESVSYLFWLFEELQLQGRLFEVPPGEKRSFLGLMISKTIDGLEFPTFKKILDLAPPEYYESDLDVLYEMIKESEARYILQINVLVGNLSEESREAQKTATMKMRKVCDQMRSLLQKKGLKMPPDPPQRALAQNGACVIS